MNALVFIIGGSLITLLVAAYVSGKHLLRRSVYLPAVMIITLILLMAIRRMVALAHAFNNHTHTADMTAESIGFVVSALILFFVIYLIRLRSSDARTVKALITVREEHQRTETALRESEDRFKTLAQASFEAIVISEHGVITDCNAQLSDLLGYGREELINRRISDLLPPEDRQRVMNNIQGDREVVIEHDLLHKSGRRCPVEAHGRPMQMNGRTFRITAIRDMTERKRMETALDDYRLHLEELVAKRTGELREKINELRFADKELHCYTAQLQELSARLVAAGEEERRFIARELHDEIGQMLTGLKLTIDMLGQTASPDQVAACDQLRKIAGELLRKVRTLSLNLHPGMLDDLGLVRALEHLAHQFKTSAGLDVRLQCTLPDARMPVPVELAAYRIVQESLTNVARHAGVSAAQVDIWRENGSLCVRIRDEGRGFDAAAALEQRSSVGLVGMRERTVSADGKLIVSAQPGAGTTIFAELPVEHLKKGVRTHINDDDYVG